MSLGSASGALTQLLGEERRRIAVLISKVRLGLAVLLVVVAFVLGPSNAPLNVLRSAGLAWLAAALVWYWLFRRESRAGKLAAIPGIVDILIFGVSHVIELAILSGADSVTTEVSFFDLYSIANTTACVLLVFSVFSFSRAGLVTAALLAGAFMTAYANIVPRAPTIGFQLVSLILPVGVAWALTAFVSRIEAVVSALRKRDLLGKYVLGDRIGVGGMAEVFLANYCPEGGFTRRLAVKRILPACARDQESIALFRREAEIGAQLTHPNIVQVFDFGATEDTYFLAMEYVEGITLWHLIQYLRESGSQVPLHALTYVAWCLADALRCVHGGVTIGADSQKLIHRDVNPPNVLLSKTGDVKLADFGIARAAGGVSVTVAGSVRGKLAYAAPEQVKGESVDERIDLYGLGVTLWETATAHKLITGASDAEVVKQILEGVDVPPSNFRDDIPPQVDQIVMTLLARSAEQRACSAEGLGQRLAHLGPEMFDVRRGREQLAQLVQSAMVRKAAPASDHASHHADLKTRKMKQQVSEVGCQI